MKFVKNKSNKTLWISLTILLIASMVIIPIPLANSQVTERSFSLFIAAGPDKIGLGQSVSIVAWGNMLPTNFISQNLSAGDGILRFPRYHNFVVTIKDPDGIVENRTFPESDPLGGNAFSYVPTKIGTYTISASYPGESFENVQYFKSNVAFKPAQTKLVTFEVQQDPIQSPIENPLPTEYWTRPIDPSNQFWADLTGNWLRMGMSSSQGRYWTNFQPYGTAPNTAHIPVSYTHLTLPTNR